MTDFAIARLTDGIVTSIVQVSDLETLMLNVPDGYEPHPCRGLPVVPGQWRWDGDALSAVPVLPPGLADLRARQWIRVKAARDRAEWGGCTTQLGRVDTDPDSQRKVSGSVQMAMIAQAAGAPFDLAWTMQDNSTVMHDGPAMIAMGVAVGRHVAACHAVALAKRAAIEGANDAAAIEAIDITGGWLEVATA